MGHRLPTRTHGRHAPPPPPPRPPRRVAPDEWALEAARGEYIAGRIDVDEFEAAVEHVLRGGLGNERFPYLPAFPMPAMENGPPRKPPRRSRDSGRSATPQVARPTEPPPKPLDAAWSAKPPIWRTELRD